METPTILVAEDNPMDCELLKHAFVQSRIINPLQFVDDGAATIEYLSGTGIYAERTKYPAPIALFLDIMMPKVTGVEVLHWLRDYSGAKPKVILLTSYLNDPRIDKAIYAGADLYVPKPLKPARLMEIGQELRWHWVLTP